jgi:hypothetical protein
MDRIQGIPESVLPQKDQTILRPGDCPLEDPDRNHFHRSRRLFARSGPFSPAGAEEETPEAQKAKQDPIALIKRGESRDGSVRYPSEETFVFSLLAPYASSGAIIRFCPQEKSGSPAIPLGNTFSRKNPTGMPAGHQTNQRWIAWKLTPMQSGPQWAPGTGETTT